MLQRGRKGLWHMWLLVRKFLAVKPYGFYLALSNGRSLVVLDEDVEVVYHMIDGVSDVHMTKLHPSAQAYAHSLASCRYVDTGADIDIEYRDKEADIEREIQMKIC